MTNQTTHCPYLQSFTCDTCEFLGCYRHPANEVQDLDFRTETDYMLQAELLEETDNLYA